MNPNRAMRKRDLSITYTLSGVNITLVADFSFSNSTTGPFADLNPASNPCKDGPKNPRRLQAQAWPCLSVLRPRTCRIYVNRPWGPTADQRYKSLKELMADGSRDRAAAQAAAARASRCFMTSWAPTGFDAPLFRMWSGIHLRRYRVGRWLLKRRHFVSFSNRRRCSSRYGW